jgi:hypothetical protein
LQRLGRTPIYAGKNGVQARNSLKRWPLKLGWSIAFNIYGKLSLAIRPPSTL